MNKIKVIKHADVRSGNYWMYDTAPEYQHDTPFQVSVTEHSGRIYVIGANAGYDESDVCDINDITETVVFVPINPPKYSELDV